MILTDILTIQLPFITHASIFTNSSTTIIVEGAVEVLQYEDSNRYPSFQKLRCNVLNGTVYLKL